MNEKKEFYVALITPFLSDGTIDYVALKKIMHRLLLEGCDGFIVNGTTAESPTLTKKEKFTILQFVIDYVNGRVSIYFGCGTNCTKETIQDCKKAEHYAIEGVLLVTPYYNKPSQSGLYAHYAAIAKATKLNIMLYQVPSRTGVALKEETIVQLIETYPNIKALKLASDEFELASHLHERYPKFKIYSGEDGSYLKGFQHGMCGVVSVMGHCCLKEMKQGKNCARVAELLFRESSPSPIKYWLMKQGECKASVRLPLSEISEQLKKEIDKCQFDMLSNGSDV